MSLFKNSYGSSQTLPKPRKPVKVDTPVYSRLYPHSGESAAGFRWVGESVNFLTEMMKFFPTWEQVGYAGEPSEDFITALGEFGNSSGSPFWEGEGDPPTLWTEESGVPEPPKRNNWDGGPGNYYVTDDNGNPYHVRANNPWGTGSDTGTGRGYTRNHFGAWHRVTGSNGLPWGFLEGGRAQNLNFHPGVSEYNHFTYDPAQRKYYAKDRLAYDRMEATGINDPLLASDYSTMLGFTAASYTDVWGGGVVPNGRTAVRVLNGGANSYLESFGDRSFYQIVMSGFRDGDVVKDVSYVPDGEGERVEWNPGVTYDFVYDGTENETFDFNGNGRIDSGETIPGAGAFKMMLGLLESRRRIFYAMTEIFGRHTNIGIMSGSTPAPNDGAMIGAFDDWTDDRTMGWAADPHNIALYSLFLEAQHSLHSVLPSFSFDPGDFSYRPADSDGGQPGWVFSGKDQLAFGRFNEWLKRGVDSYLSWLDSRGSSYDSYESRVRNLCDEFYGEGDYERQPYIGTRNLEGGEKRAGWDKYCEDYNSEHTPRNGNPISAGPHTGFIRGQLQGINMLGNRNGTVYDSSGHPVEGGGNLATRNWGVHSLLSLKRYEDWDVGRNIAISTQNRRKRLEYKQAMEEYHWEKIELQRQEARDEAKMKQRVAEQNADLSALIKKAKEQNDGLKMAQAASVRAKIEQKMAEKRSRQRRKKK